MRKKGFGFIVIAAFLYSCSGLGSGLSYTAYKIRNFLEDVRAYFTEAPSVTWSKSVPKVFIDADVYIRKFDKVKMFLSFLRVKQSWIAG